MKGILIAITMFFVIARVFSGSIPEGLLLNTFKALAHVYVGGLFGAWLVNFKWGVETILDLLRIQWQNFYFKLAVLLTVVEITCFAISRL